jgi:hypothetical protein
MAKQSLTDIIDAADPADREDVAIRKLLVAALSDGGIELPQVMNGRSPLLNSCERGTSRRLNVIRSPSRRGRSSVLDGRSHCPPQIGRRARSRSGAVRARRATEE